MDKILKLTMEILLDIEKKNVILITIFCLLNKQNIQ